MPRYDFKCKCGFVDEVVCRVKDLPKMHISCDKCGEAMHNDVASNARTQNPKTIKTYFSEQLDAEVTGPMQFEELCKRRGVTPIPQGITREIPDHMKQRTEYDKKRISEGINRMKNDPTISVGSEAI